MADRMRKFVKEEVITRAYILLCIALSSGQIFFNKNCPFSMSRKLNQYQKAYMIVVQSGGLSDFWAARDWVVSIAVFTIGVAAGLEVMSCRMLFTIALCLFIQWIFLEKPKMDAEGTWNFQPLILTLNSLYPFALNLSVFLVITCTSALTIPVAGVVKDWVVLLLFALQFADTKLTIIDLFGYGIGDIFFNAIAGVGAYNNHKLKKEASRGTSDESQHAESVPLVSSSTSDK